MATASPRDLATDIAPTHRIRGIHHLTAVCADAQRTVDFYTQTLGLRLVKQTVNFDDPGAYHLYFGNDQAAPSSLLTFFEWPDAGPGRTGIGATHHIAFATADRDALLRWKRWLTGRGLAVTGPYDRVYFQSIYFQDPDGLIIEIATRGPGWTVDEVPDALGTELKPPPFETTVGGRDEAAIAAETWPEPVATPDATMRLNAIHHITAIASDAERTLAFYTETLGMRFVKRTLNFDNPDSPHLYVGVGDGAPGTIVTWFGYRPGQMRRGVVGHGMTHHVAFHVADEDALRAWQGHLAAAGVPATEIRDRQYFKSVYFQDPDGHILELATAGPGFATDEAPEALGRALRLPPWLAGQNDEIAAGLTPLQVPEPAGR
ncbi:MAG: Glyoxalase family protein [uncultured Thermomicrobiales bacterium]|uniref:Glyoxalase family protein n=1 Tax=uncultured Thermomicrobiales bacterium TaxID=1645740 RepID=A0A6J4V9M7_9BACT|nr:MAG: Glyoxalase family protein [uncultured Thermomicrobiales bacterium]